MIRKLRFQRKTLLVVGEGDTEVAFLKYLRSLYCASGKGAKVTVDNAHGKSPENIVNSAIRHLGSAAFDKKVCLLDTDIAWPPAVCTKAKKNKVTMLGATPCSEGLFLDILGVPFASITDECKSKIASMFNFSLTNERNYPRAFDRNKLDEARQRIRTLNDLLNFYEAI